jgi:hypothetical protein
MGPAAWAGDAGSPRCQQRSRPCETAPLRIGTRDLKSFFLGAIRGVRVWNRALTAAEVQMVASDSVPQDGLVAEYRLDQDVALDTTGLHNGRIVGGLWMPFRRGSLTK